jgi:ribonuclease HI
MLKDKIIIYTDGGARGNPGPAGSGAVITDSAGKILKEVHTALGVATNNIAEYNGVLIGLEALKKMFGKEKLAHIEIEVRMDSELVVKQMNGIYKVKDANLKLLFADICSMRAAHFPHLKFTHIPREKNKEADRMSNIAMDESEKLI